MARRRVRAALVLVIGFGIGLALVRLAEALAGALVPGVVVG